MAELLEAYLQWIATSAIRAAWVALYVNLGVVLRRWETQ